MRIVVKWFVIVLPLNFYISPKIVKFGIKVIYVFCKLVISLWARNVPLQVVFDTYQAWKIFRLEKFSRNSYTLHISCKPSIRIHGMTFSFMVDIKNNISMDIIPLCLELLVWTKYPYPHIVKGRHRVPSYYIEVFTL